MDRTKSRNVAVGVFYSQAEAQRAVSELKSMGFTEEEIGVVAHQPKGEDPHQITHGAADNRKDTKAAEGATAGAMAGAGVGALWALGIAAGILPAIGPVVAGGILSSILLSAAGGAVAAGLAGALIGLGIPEEEAQYYEQEFKAGRTIVTVRANGRYDEAVRIMQRHNGFDMNGSSSRAQSSSSNTAVNQKTSRAATSGKQPAAMPHNTPRSASAMCSTQHAAEGQKVQLKDEELDISKHAVKKGEVRVGKEIVTEHKTVDVPVTREEVVIERRPAGTGTTSTAAGKMGDRQEIRIPVTEEEVDVRKRTVAREDVTVGKRKVQQKRTVSEDVRHEKLKVDRSGDVNVKHTSK